MHIIQSPADAFCLSVPPVRQLRLVDELTEYADRSLIATATPRGETQTQPLHLLSDEEKHLSEQLTTYLHHLAYSVEYIIRLDGLLSLALTTLSNSGQDFYLLLPPSATFTGAAELIAIAEPSGY